MNKTIKSVVRELLFRIISKYEAKKLAKDAEFQQKQDCLRIVKEFLGTLKGGVRAAEILQAIDKLTDLEQKDTIKTQNQYLKEISSLTEISVITLKRFKKEGAENEDKYKERDRIIESNLDAFILNAGNSSDSSDSEESLQVEYLDFDSD